MKMAAVTVELRNLLKTDFKLFDFDYQFDDTIFKKELEDHIINFYYGYEIGFDTPDMFKHKFKSKWLRMITYYNTLYNTTLLKYNPLTNYSISEALEQLATVDSTQDNTTDSTQDTNSDSTRNGHTFTDSDNKTSDYPQQAIAGGDFLDGASNTISDTTTEDKDNTSQKVTDKSSGKITAKGKTDTSYSKKIEGITGTTYQELITKQRSLILNIPDMVIEEMKSCFILVY